jgi:hypothetical protein
MGARQSGNGSLAGFRNALANPVVRSVASIVPAFRAPFALANLVNYGISAYEKSQANQNPYADDSMDRLSFNAPAYGQAGPEYGPAPTTSLDSNPYEGGFYGPGAFNENAVNMGGRTGSVNVEGNALVGGPVSQPNLSVTTFDGASYSPPSAVEQQAQNFGGESVGFGGGFGGGVGTGDFGGSPADAADLGYAHGGMVTPDRLMGRAPAPDDGYGALQGGEYVITKAAVEKYGKRLLDAINNGTFR